jgi:formylglycine-generating enzyme required for sulfatase activity
VPVGSYPYGVSRVGADDMAGNVMEWVQDWLGPDYYQLSPTDDPPGPTSGTTKWRKGDGSGATSSWLGLPTAISRTPRTTRTSTSASGSSPRDGRLPTGSALSLPAAPDRDAPSAAQSTLGRRGAQTRAPGAFLTALGHCIGT